MPDQQRMDALFSWRATVGSLLAVVVTIGLALLLIEPLSVEAAVRGGLIAIGALALSRLLLWALVKRRRSG